MKVIFLDIDGVMNSELFYRHRHRMRWFRLSFYYYLVIARIKWIFNGFKYKATSLVGYKIPDKFKAFDYKYNHLIKETDPIKWKWLVQLCKDTDAKICISSVWKYHFSLDRSQPGWACALNRLGFPPYSFVGITPDRETLRGTEIQNWMINELKTIDSIEKYAIIDDDSDMLPEQMFSFFQCDSYIGLTPTLCYRIKNHLL